MSKPVYKRVLLKLSGEALMGNKQGGGIDPEILRIVSQEIRDIRGMGVEIAVVVGGGNIFRGVSGCMQGLDRTTGDYMGMLATVINALALQDMLESYNVWSRRGYRCGSRPPLKCAPSPSRTSAPGPSGTWRRGEW